MALKNLLKQVLYYKCILMILTNFNSQQLINFNLKNNSNAFNKTKLRFNNLMPFYNKTLGAKQNTTYFKNTKSKNTSFSKNIYDYKKKHFKCLKNYNIFKYNYKNVCNIKLILTGYTHDDLVQGRKILNNYFKRLSYFLLKLTFIESHSNHYMLADDLIKAPFNKHLNFKNIKNNELKPFNKPQTNRIHRKNAYNLSQHIAYVTASYFKKIPSHTTMFTTIRSPFVFKKTREQFTYAKLAYSMCLNIKCASQQQQVISLLKLVKLPCELKIKVIV